MAKQSAGLLVYKIQHGKLFVLLAHPGGPFYRNKDDGVWTIPKGEFENEDALTAAKREFKEELGLELTGKFIELKPCKIKSGKVIYAYAIKADVDVSSISSNVFSIEWPPKSGKQQTFPEIDKAEWFEYKAARIKILPGQIPLLDELISITT